LGIEVGVDLVEQVERGRVALLDRKHYRWAMNIELATRSRRIEVQGKARLTSGQGDERLLTSRELLYTKALVALRVERDLGEEMERLLSECRWDLDGSD
jgi:hypothetical protein